MNHSFNVEFATKYGILEAVIFENISFWVAKNKANGKNFHDGYYWTYNTTAAFAELFPYATKRQVEKALHNLRDDGLIKTGVYNEFKYDRTLWYTVTDRWQAISSSGNMEKRNQVIPDNQKCEPIPFDKPSVENSFIPPNPQKGECAEEQTKNKKSIDSKCDEVIELFKSICTDLPKPQKITSSRRKAINRAWKDIEDFGGWEKFFNRIAESDFLSGRNSSWKASFDWVLKPSNREKIIEGNYVNKPYPQNNQNFHPATKPEDYHLDNPMDIFG